MLTGIMFNAYAQAAQAALATIAGVAGQSAKKREDEERERRAKDQFRRNTIADIMQRRTHASGADTLQSDVARRENEFLLNLAANRRDTSGDWVPVVQGLSGIAQSMAGPINSASAKPVAQPSAPKLQAYAGPDVHANVNDDADEYLRRLLDRGEYV